MYRGRFSILFFLALVFSSVIWAHDPSKHKGKATKGEVISIAGDRIELKTANGTKTVTITDKTKFERGNETVGRDELKKGDQVTILGTRLATGELVAREILLGQPDAPSAQKKKPEHKH